MVSTRLLRKGAGKGEVADYESHKAAARLRSWTGKRTNGLCEQLTQFVRRSAAAAETVGTEISGLTVAEKKSWSRTKFTTQTKERGANLEEIEKSVELFANSNLIPTVLQAPPNLPHTSVCVCVLSVRRATEHC